MAGGEHIEGTPKVILKIELAKGVQQEIHYVKAFAVLRQRVERLERCFVTDIGVMPAK